MSEKKITLVCPHCQNDNQKMIEITLGPTKFGDRIFTRYKCEVCSKEWTNNEEISNGKLN